jgi:hypothetical protein
LRNLGKHIVGKIVAGVHQTAITGRIHRLEVQGQQCPGGAFHAHQLCRYSHPGVSGTQQLGVA